MFHSQSHPHNCLFISPCLPTYCLHCSNWLNTYSFLAMMDKCKGVLQDKQEEVSVRTGPPPPVTHSRRGRQSCAEPPAPRNSTLLRQCLFPPWQTVFQNHHQVSKNKKAVAYMLLFIQWPKGQKSIKGRDVKYFPLNTDPYWLCIYTHVF